MEKPPIEVNTNLESGAGNAKIETAKEVSTKKEGPKTNTKKEAHKKAIENKKVGQVKKDIEKSFDKNKQEKETEIEKQKNALIKFISDERERVQAMIDKTSWVKFSKLDSLKKGLDNLDKLRDTMNNSGNSIPDFTGVNFLVLSPEIDKLAYSYQKSLSDEEKYSPKINTENNETKETPTETPSQKEEKVEPVTPPTQKEEVVFKPETITVNEGQTITPPSEKEPAQAIEAEKEPENAEKTTESSDTDKSMEKFLEEELERRKQVEEMINKDAEDQAGVDAENEESRQMNEKSKQMMYMELPIHEETEEDTSWMDERIANKEKDIKPKESTNKEEGDMEWIDDILIDKNPETLPKNENIEKSQKILRTQKVEESDYESYKKQQNESPERRAYIQRANELSNKIVDTILHNDDVKEEKEQEQWENERKDKERILARYAEVKKRQIEIAPLLDNSKNRSLVEENDELIKEAVSLEKEIEKIRQRESVRINRISVEKEPDELIEEKIQVPLDEETKSQEEKVNESLIKEDVVEETATNLPEQTPIIEPEQEIVENPLQVGEKETSVEIQNQNQEKAPEPEQIAPTEPTKIEVNPVVPIAPPEEIKETGAFIMPKNAGFWGRATEKARSVLSNLYKGTGEIMSNNRLVAKMGVAYNQFWVDHKEGKSVALKERVDGYAIERNALNQSMNKMQEIANNLKASGNPGFASILLDIKKIAKQEISLANKQGKFQTKLEIRENEIKSYTNKRDAIADKMVNKYEKNLSPIEEKLRILEERRDDMNLFVLGREAELEEGKANLNYQQEQKESLIKSLMSAGQSLEKASRNRSVRSIEKIIADGNKKIEKTKSGLKDQQNKINKEINNADNKAQPHREKRDQFIRVKAGRPIDLNLEKRQALNNPKTFEEASIYTRTAPNNTNIDQAPTSTNLSSSNKGFESSSWFRNTPKIGDLIDDLNQFLERNSAQNLKIDNSIFLNKLRLSNENKVTLPKFKKMIALYYKTKKIPESEYRELVKN